MSGFGKEAKRAAALAKKKREEEQLFKAGVEWWLNACLDPFHADWYAYTEGYKRAANVLVEHVRGKRSDLDVLVYPIIFLYRQCMELRLKHIIGNGRRLLDQTGKYPKHHKLDKLWGEARKILEEVYEGDPKEDLVQVEEYINQFCSRDPFGSAFRYPTDKNGNKALPGLTHINIGEFSETVMKVVRLLDGASAGIDEYLGWKMEMQSEY